MKNEWSQVAGQDALNAEKEMFMTGGGVKVGQTTEEYKTEREEIWNRMHPPEEQPQVEETSETLINKENNVNNSESAIDSTKQEELHIQAVETQVVKDRGDLKRVRQELGLVTPPEEKLTGSLGKVQEYDERIRAAKEGKPIKPGDTEAGLLLDFKSFTKQDWSEDFDISKFQKRRETQKEPQEIIPIKIDRLQENPNIERRKYDANNFSFKQEGNKVKILFSGKEWDVKSGQFIEKEVGGKVIRVILAEGGVEHASYQPITDIYTIGPKALEEFNQDPEMFLSTMNHEAAHGTYFSLSEKEQRKINDVFLKSKDLQEILNKFATALYTDKYPYGKWTAGEDYLETHNVNNKATTSNHLVIDGQLGVKDARSIVFELDGKERETFVSSLITEMISYMSSLEISKDVFEKVAKNGKDKRGGEDPRYDVVQMCHEYIKNNPQIYEQFKKLKLLGRDSEKEEYFVSLLKNQIGRPSNLEKASIPEKPKGKEEKLVDLKKRRELISWSASYELAKVAKNEGIDLAELSREEYAEYAIKNSLAIDDDQLRMAPWQRMSTSITDILERRKNVKLAINKKADEAFDKFTLDIKTRAGQGEQVRFIKDRIKVRAGTKNSDSWLFFGINESLDSDRSETYKAYASVKDLNTFTPEKFISFLEALRDAGYSGDVKTFQELAAQGTGLNDQIVMHGRSEKDSKLALEIAEKFFGEDLDKKGIGKDEMIDGKEYSYSQILAKRIKSEIEAKTS